MSCKRLSAAVWIPLMYLKVGRKVQGMCYFCISLFLYPFESYISYTYNFNLTFNVYFIGNCISTCFSFQMVKLTTHGKGCVCVCFVGEIEVFNMRFLRFIRIYQTYETLWGLSFDHSERLVLHQKILQLYKQNRHYVTHFT